MDNTENLSAKEINELIDSLNSYKTPEENIVLNSRIFDTITLDNNIQPLTTSHNSALSSSPYGIQPLTTSQISSLSSSPYGINTVPNSISINLTNSGINQSYNWQNQNTWLSGLSSNETALKVDGDADIKGDIKLQGKSLKNILEGIEKRLGILHSNKDLEDKWEELKELAIRYRELEAEIIAKEEMFKTLKN